MIFVGASPALAQKEEMSRDEFVTRYKAFLEEHDCSDRSDMHIFVLCLTPDGSVYASVLHLIPRSGAERRIHEYNPVLARHYIRRDALSKSRAHLKAQLDIIRDDYGIEVPFMYEMYREEMDWAGQEKQKSSEYLYQMSKESLNNPYITNEQLRSHLALTYRMLAEDKGHPQAIDEMKETRHKLLLKWSPEYAEEHSE